MLSFRLHAVSNSLHFDKLVFFVLRTVKYREVLQPRYICFDFHLILQVDVCRVILFYKWMSVMSSYFTSRCLSCHLILQVDVCRVILFYKWMSVVSSYFTSGCLSCHLILQVDICRVILFYQ